ncbi:MAG: hypothetical protein AAGG48_23685 [Planctomycetota bacterium]
MKVQFHSVCFALSAIWPVCIAGCAVTKQEPVAETYETVAADPSRDTETARHLHEKAVKIIGNAMDPHLMKCGCLAGIVGDVNKAEKLLHDALIADVRFGPAHNTLGLLYYYQRRLYLAAWEFEFAADLMPGRPEPLNNLGLVYEEATQLHRAAEYYQMALAAAPGHPEALGNLARVEIRLGGEPEFVRPILKELLMNDSRPEWIGWAEDQLGVHQSLASALLPQESLQDSGVKAVPFNEELPLPPNDTNEELELIPTPSPNQSP